MIFFFYFFVIFFFFKQKTAYDIKECDWSSDVCSSDLFDVSWDQILVRGVGALGFLLPVFVAAYFFLKTREVAR